MVSIYRTKNHSGGYCKEYKIAKEHSANGVTVSMKGFYDLYDTFHCWFFSVLVDNQNFEGL
jgi:hypothetical protein